MFELVETSINKLRDKIGPIQFCMMTTVNEEEGLSSRPMTCQGIDNDGTLWFFTADETKVAHDIQLLPRINITFAEPKDRVYVSMSGDAELVKDVQKAKQLWSPMVDVWFPNGPTDAALSLIKFSAYTAEYWDSHSNKMLQFFAMAKATLTGNAVRPSSEHGKLRF